MAERNGTIAVVANSLVSPASMSGGDRILLELSKRWEEAGQNVDFYSCADAALLFERNMRNPSCKLLSTASLQRFGTMAGYMIRLLQSLLIVKKGRVAGIVFSSSDFLTDLIPCCLFKRRFPGTRLVAALYLRAPSPFTTKYARSARGLAYFFSQRIALGLMKYYADRIYVLNDYDREFLEGIGLKDRVRVIRGGVDLELIRKVAPARPEKYDACFVGRLHEQKGVDDLIEIWNHVCKVRAHSRLAIIGWGDERRVARLKNRISEQDLNENVDFLGFLDGADKIAALKSSKILVFPSSRESWGLVVCEAIAAGVPVVSYDLDVLRRTFLGGLRTVPLGDKEGFSRAIVWLLEDTNGYQSLRSECIHLATKFGWNQVAQETLADFQSLSSNRSASPRVARRRFPLQGRYDPLPTFGDRIVRLLARLLPSPLRKHSFYFLPGFFWGDFIRHNLGPETKSVLDIGCGCGVPFSGHSSRFGFKVGMDLFLPYLRECKSQERFDEVLLADARYPPFRNASFDGVLLFEVLEHMKKGEGENVVQDAKAIASRAVLGSSPVGFLSQGALDNNPFQVYKSAWIPRDLEAMGFRVRGFGGLRRSPRGSLIMRVLQFVGFTLVSEIFVLLIPSFGRQMFFTLHKANANNKT